MKVALLGCGVIGSRVAELLLNNLNFELEKILVKDLKKNRTRSSGEVFPKSIFTTDPAQIIKNPEIELIIELLGNEQPALNYVLESIENKKHVVSANKELISKHGKQLFQRALENKVCLKIDASVGGGIPVISNLVENLKTSEITEILGILNGTTNYILSQMSNKSKSFENALKDAQAKGYAEPDPSNDLYGFDTKYKISILASIAFNQVIDPEEINCLGISNITALDFQFAKELDSSIKLLGSAYKRPDQSINVSVQPYLVPNDLILSKIDGVLNAVQFKGDLVQELTLIGPGAGPDPTSNSILSDALAILEKRYSLENLRVYSNQNAQQINSTPEEGKFYLRLTVQDKAGVLKEITKVFSDSQISIESISQKLLETTESGSHFEKANLILLTHRTNKILFEQTVRELKKLPEVNSIECTLKVLEKISKDSKSKSKQK